MGAGPSDRELRRQRDRFLFFAFAAADLFLETTGEGEILFALGAGRDSLGGRPESLIGKRLGDLVGETDRALVEILLSDFEPGVRFGPLGVGVADGGPANRRVFIQGYRLPERRDRFYIAVSAAPGVLALSETQRHDRAQGHAQPFEEETFAETVEATLVQARRSGRTINLTLLEIGGLKDARERLDVEVLGETLERMATLLRAQSFGGQPISRLSAERFAVLHDAAVPGWRLAQNAARSGEVAGLTVTQDTVSVSNPDLSPWDSARAVVYTAKMFAISGGGAPTIHCLSESYEKMLADAALRIADTKSTLANNRIDFAFQPIVDLETRQVTRYEVLARIDGKGSPFQFMTFAEHVGLIGDVDLHVCRQTLARLHNDPWLGDKAVAVNLSGRSLQTERFVESLFALLAEVPAQIRSRLMFEVTESAQIHDLEAVSKIIAALRREGFRIGLDDFGAGSNSFSTLYQLEVDFIKIDGNYVSRIMESARDVAMLKAMVGLAHDLGIPTVAERIETEAQVSKLRALKVDQGQGYLFGKPELRRFRPAVDDRTNGTVNGKVVAAPLQALVTANDGTPPATAARHEQRGFALAGRRPAAAAARS